MPRSKYTAEQKYDLIQQFNKAGMSHGAFAKLISVERKTFVRWIRFLNEGGISALEEQKHWHRYSEELKLSLVMDYQTGNYSKSELIKKYKLRSFSQVQNWIIKYNGTNEVTATPSRKLVPKMSRKTTFDERVEITEYAIEHKNNYNETATKFNVSYQQVRSWVLKVDKDGFEALKDRRGKQKNVDEMTEVEHLQLEIKKLKAELKSKEMAEKFAKKLLEIRNRR